MLGWRREVTVSEWSEKPWPNGLTIDELAAIEARARAATSEPWVMHRADPHPSGRPKLVLHGGGGDELVQTWTWIADINDQLGEDAEFILHARGDVPRLIGEVRWLQVQVQALEEQLVQQRRDRASLMVFSMAAAMFLLVKSIGGVSRK